MDKYEAARLGGNHPGGIYPQGWPTLGTHGLVGQKFFPTQRPIAVLTKPRFSAFFHFWPVFLFFHVNKIGKVVFLMTNVIKSQEKHYLTIGHQKFLVQVSRLDKTFVKISRKKRPKGQKGLENGIIFFQLHNACKFWANIL